MNTVRLQGMADSASGFARISRQWLYHLPSLGWAVEFSATRADPTYCPVPDAQAPASVSSPSDVDVVVECIDQLRSLDVADKLVATMWEAPRLPADLVTLLNTARCIIVPSECCAAVFAANGVATPIRIVPLGIDPAFYYDDGAIRDNRLIAIAGRSGYGSKRKAFDIALEAFGIVRRKHPGAILRIKTLCDPRRDADMLRPRDNVILDEAYYEERDMAAWYRKAGIYLACSRAEGFGLHALEAAACGCLVVGHRWFGAAHNTFAHDGLPFVLKACDDDCYRGLGVWAEVCPQALALVISQMIEFPDAWRIKRQECAFKAATSWTWQQSTQALVRVLEEFR